MAARPIERLNPLEPTNRELPGSRQRLFLLVAGVVALAGCLYTAFQPATYRSSATVLSSALPAIDQAVMEPDLQGVAIQRHRLLGEEIMRSLAQRLRTDGGYQLDAEVLRSLLEVSASPDTNLLDLSATGSEETLLSPLVSSWIEVYAELRSQDIEERRDETLRRVEGELRGLDERILIARQKLEEYRAEHEIVSMGRQENAVLARLDGLNTALNNAVEEQVLARAHLEALQQSLRDGAQVVAQSARSEVAAMAGQLSELRAELAELLARYTQDYIDKDPRLRQIPEQIDELETALSAAYSEGAKIELANAERDVVAATESIEDLERRLASQKDEAAAFTSIYATHEALVADLGRLEELYRDTQARLVSVDVRRVDQYPQLTVIRAPGSVAERVGPAYGLLLGATAIAALVAGIFAVWLRGFLNPPPREPTFVTVTGTPVYPADAAVSLDVKAGPAALEGKDAPEALPGADSAPPGDGGSS